MRICDLHVHSIYSDGTDTPRELIDAAVALGLSAVALCDHNTADGLPAFLDAAKDSPIEAIAGAEFSVDYAGRELHLLGLFIPEEGFSEVTALTEDVQARKRESNKALISSLNAAGYLLDYDELCAATPNGKFNRAHVAARLVALGYTESPKAAFDTLLHPKFGHYKEPERLDFFEMLGFLGRLGAVSVLAHPFLNLTRKALETLLPRAKACGLAGMECFYSEYDDTTAADALALAKRFGLLPSGGSDYHGDNKPHIALGRGTGNLAIPYEWAEALKKQQA